MKQACAILLVVVVIALVVAGVRTGLSTFRSSIAPHDSTALVLINETGTSATIELNLTCGDRPHPHRTINIAPGETIELTLADCANPMLDGVRVTMGHTTDEHDVCGDWWPGERHRLRLLEQGGVVLEAAWEGARD